MKKWQITFTDEAGLDLGFFIENHPDIWSEIRHIMNLLAQEDDPRHPRNSELNVAAVEHDAAGWWRVYVGKPGPQWVRVVFTLLGTRLGHEVEIEISEYPHEFDEPRTIQITDVIFREKAYGKRLRDRHRKYREQRKRKD